MALAAVVATLRVAVAVLLAGGVTEPLGLNEQVGPLVTAGVTAQVSATTAEKLFTEVTVIVAVAETPGLPDAADNAPLVTVKLPDVVAVWLYFATKASKLPPPKIVWYAPLVVGKLAVGDTVLPVTTILAPALSTAIPPTGLKFGPAVVESSFPDPPR
jgi:hypothetical protein